MKFFCCCKKQKPETPSKLLPQSAPLQVVPASQNVLHRTTIDENIPHETVVVNPVHKSLKP